MAYKVFLVEDEIVTREGIRDSVDWAAAGYEFCGEAPDGELALPLIRERRPETVITDIKMPFMDGLQLCRRLKETLPATKIIILSGHDEFRYAQEAIQIGVTEYLLKPIVPQDLRRRAAQGRPADRGGGGGSARPARQIAALEAQMADQRSMRYASPADLRTSDGLDHDPPAHSHQALINKARAYIDLHYADVDISPERGGGGYSTEPQLLQRGLWPRGRRDVYRIPDPTSIREASSCSSSTALTLARGVRSLSHHGYHNLRYCAGVPQGHGLPPHERVPSGGCESGVEVRSRGRELRKLSSWLPAHPPLIPFYFYLLRFALLPSGIARLPQEAHMDDLPMFESPLTWCCTPSGIGRPARIASQKTSPTARRRVLAVLRFVCRAASRGDARKANCLEPAPHDPNGWGSARRVLTWMQREIEVQTRLGELLLHSRRRFRAMFSTCGGGNADWRW